MQYRPIAAFAAAALIAAAPAAGAAESLYGSLSRRPDVKVHVATPEDATGKDKARTAELKKAVEAALEGRKSVNFSVVPGPEAADLRVAIRVVDCFWTPHDPVDMILGVGAVALDAAMQDPYVAMQADVTIADASGKELWKDRVRATITKKGMDEAAGLSLINDDWAKVFVRTAFGKKKGRR